MTGNFTTGNAGKELGLKEKYLELEKKNAALQKQLDGFRTITENSCPPLLIHEHGTIVYVNDAWCELHQTCAEDAILKGMKAFASPDLSTIDGSKTFSETNSPEMIRFVEAALQAGRDSNSKEMVEWRIANTAVDSSQGLLIRENGELRWIATQRALIFFSGKQAVLNTEHDVTDLILAEQRMKESDERYRALFEQTMVNIVLMGEDGEHIYNKNAFEVLGYTREEFEALTLDRTETIKNSKQVNEQHRRIREQGTVEVFETKLRHKNGDLIDMLIHSSPILIGGKNYVQNISIDISGRKKAESLLKKAHDELEIRVAERTEELKAQSDSLAETNTALKVLLKNRVEDKQEQENKILTNIQTLVTPSVEKLKNTTLTTAQQSYLNVLESSLQDVISPLFQKLPMINLSFTPSEIQIVNLIKQGRTTKEIAGYLGLSSKTIEFHRNSIRKKLGLSNVKANLRTYLQSIN